MLNNPQLIKNSSDNPGIATDSPEWVTINIDGRCNLKCIYCPYHGSQRLVSPNTFYVNFEQFKPQADLAMRFAKRVHVCAVGEPFLNKDIFKMFNYMNEQGYPPSVLTNGTSVISDKLERIVDARLTSYNTDVDTLYSDKYKRMCGQDELGVVLSNIEKINELKAQKNVEMRMVVNTLINRTVLPELESMFHRFLELGVDTWRLTCLSIPLDGTDFMTRHNAMLDEPETLHSYVNRLRELAEGTALDVEVSGFIDPEVSNKDLKCSTLWRRMMLNVPSADIPREKWYGNVVPGCMLSLEGYSMGNMFDSSLEEIWNNEKYIAMRNDLLAGNIHRCTHLCPAQAFPESPGEKA